MSNIEKINEKARLLTECYDKDEIEEMVKIRLKGLLKAIENGKSIDILTRKIAYTTLWLSVYAESIGIEYDSLEDAVLNKMVE